MAKFKLIWSEEAIDDLRRIYAITFKFTKSRAGAQAVKRDILDTAKTVVFAKQHQADEFLGEPYRRMIVRQYRIVYKEMPKNEIHILFLFNNRNSPTQLIQRIQ